MPDRRLGVRQIGSRGPRRIVALLRDEQISALRLLAAALGSYAIAYRFCAHFISHKVLGIDTARATPAERLH